MPSLGWWLPEHGEQAQSRELCSTLMQCDGRACCVSFMQNDFRVGCLSMNRCISAARFAFAAITATPLSAGAPPEKYPQLARKPSRIKYLYRPGAPS